MQIPDILMKAYLLIFLGLSMSAGLRAQSLKYRDYEYKWPEGSPRPVKLEERFKDEDAVILEESTKISLSGDDTEKYMRIRYLTPAGIKAHGVFLLPESLDPSSDYLGVPLSKRDSVMRPKIGDDRFLKYFAARIIRPDGSIKAAEIHDESQKEAPRMSEPGKNLFYAYRFTILNLEPGDELEVNYYRYSYKNWGRLFFHGKIPKQSASFSIRWNTKYIYCFQFHNGGQPMDSSAKSGYSTYTWRFTNLPGCLDEVNARYHLELPFVSYYRQMEDFYAVLANSRQVFVPYTWSFKLMDASNRLSNRDKKYFISEKAENRNVLDRFFHSLTDTLRDTSALSRIARIHAYINEEFEYQHDNEFMSGEDPRMERLDKFTEARKLREISRYNLYHSLFYRLQTPFYMAMLHDTRVEKIDPGRFYYDYRRYWYYTLMSNERFYYIHPKDQRYGLYMNEMPFYLESAPTILTPQCVDDDGSDTYRYVITNTPGSSEKENIRNTLVIAAVSTDSLKITFDAKVILQGQFSTMTRAAYIPGMVDSSVSPLYYRRISDIPGGRLLNSEVLSRSTVFPFRTSIKLHYEAAALKRGTGSEYTIPLAGWFNHMVCRDFSARNRTLSFFPDFRSSDSFTYQLKFDKKVQLLNAGEFSSEARNKLGTYLLKATQVDDSTIQLESSFRVMAGSVPPESAADVEAIYSVLNRLDTSQLKIRKTE
jgi:hypothetical protein